MPAVKPWSVALPCAVALRCLLGAWSAEAGNADFVDPFIGTAAGAQPYAKGNTFPGATVPNGMVQISPDTSPRYSGGYRSGAPSIEGFSQNHMSGVGCSGDLGNILLMPTVGAVGTTETAYRSGYSDEAASPGYYRVTLTKGGIGAEMSATTRATIARFTFPERDGDANILVDVSHGLTPSRDGLVRIVSPTEVEGYNDTGGFCGSDLAYRVYFVARFSKPAVTIGTWQGTTTGAETTRTGADVGAYFRFDTAAGERVEVRLGLSYVGIAGARANLTTEIPASATFDKVRAAALAQWNKDLGRVDVTGGTPQQRRIFYTALYHALLHPSVNSDVDGSYPGMNGAGVRKAVGYTHYHLFSLWDTYRSLHPLLTLLYPRRQRDMVRTMVAMAQEGGWLPKWEMVARERLGMVGDPAAIVIADTYLKGITAFDVEAAYAAMRKSATVTDASNPVRPCLAPYLSLGYLPQDTCPSRGSVSVTQEYAYADHAISQLAARLGKLADRDEFTRRSVTYRQLFDPGTAFLRPRRANGALLSPVRSALLRARQRQVSGTGLCRGHGMAVSVHGPARHRRPDGPDGRQRSIPGQAEFRLRSGRRPLLADQPARHALSVPVHLRAGSGLADAAAGPPGSLEPVRCQPCGAPRQ